mmetsp:Transcript_18433/g.69739  ORF Transcript_18433/g.69739 Transcript_18433/m.69739 type:complete len:102 (+) Transcript_18433:75-380(+)|eukprot:scaffold79_cov259-Pinguiococcus_pyrenoidosus.AAC.21
MWRGLEIGRTFVEAVRELQSEDIVSQAIAEAFLEEFDRSMDELMQMYTEESSAKAVAELRQFNACAGLWRLELEQLTLDYGGSQKRFPKAALFLLGSGPDT